MNYTCACVDGFEQNAEFLFRDVSPYVVSYCDFNPTIHIVLSSLVMVLVVPNLILYSLVIQSRRQVSSEIPTPKERKI